MLNKKQVARILLCFILIALISGCNGFDNNFENEKYDYRLDSLIITFNGERRNELFASSSNIDFRNFFLKEIDEFDNISEVNNTAIDWYDIFNGSNLKINYQENVTDTKKNDILKNLSNFLRSKWYVEKIDYDLIDRTIDSPNSDLPKIDVEVIKKINENGTIRVIVVLKEFNLTNQDDVINSYYEFFNDIHKSNTGGWFSTDISEKTINMLKNETRIKRIYISKISKIQNEN